MIDYQLVFEPSPALRSITAEGRDATLALHGMEPDHRGIDDSFFVPGRPNSGAIIARVDGIAVGCAAYRPLDGKPGAAELRHVYVRPSLRRRGVAEWMVRKIEGLARSHGIRTLFLEVGPLQEAAHALYRKLGYREVPDYGATTGGPGSFYFSKDIAQG